MNKDKLPLGPIYIPSHSEIPWHECNIGSTLSYSPDRLTTILFLYTKDHKTIVEISNEEWENLSSEYEKTNWELVQLHKWQKDLEALYRNMGD